MKNRILALIAFFALVAFLPGTTHAQQRPSGGLEIAPGSPIIVHKGSEIQGLTHRYYLGLVFPPSTAVATTNLANGVVTVAGQPSGAGTVARAIALTKTVTDGIDPFTLTITGTDAVGATISETLVNPNTSAYTSQAFLTVSSVVISGWSANGGTDTFSLAYTNRYGLPITLAATNSSDFVIMFGAGTNLINTVVSSGAKGGCLVTGDLSGTLSSVGSPLDLFFFTDRRTKTNPNRN